MLPHRPQPHQVHQNKKLTTVSCISHQQSTSHKLFLFLLSLQIFRIMLPVRRDSVITHPPHRSLLLLTCNPLTSNNNTKLQLIFNNTLKLNGLSRHQLSWGHRQLADKNHTASNRFHTIPLIAIFRLARLMCQSGNKRITFPSNLQLNTRFNTFKLQLSTHLQPPIIMRRKSNKP